MNGESAKMQATGGDSGNAVKSTRNPDQFMKRFSLISCLYAAILGAFLATPATWFGCASLSPGADPLVVRCEQAETTANSTFTLTLTVDNNDRGFWRTNAPAFHSFCEWLRQPVALPSGSITNSLPRNLAMIEQLDQVKLAYKSASISSNTVYTVLTTLLSAESQASAWLAITTNGLHTL